MNTDHVPSRQQTANNAPADYQAWREARWDEIAGPNGKATVVANGRVSGRETHVVSGVPGQWRISEAGTLTVSATAADSVTVNREAGNGTAEVPSGSTLELSGSRVGSREARAGSTAWSSWTPQLSHGRACAGSTPTPTTRAGSSKASTERLRRVAGSTWTA